jgi:hypothetical protein
MKIAMTENAAGNHFVAGRSGTFIPNVTPDEFMTALAERMASGDTILSGGYAPFCKHIFVRNFTNASAGVARITDGNRHWLMTGYEARRPEELPVLVRWFPRDAMPLERSEWLDVILYSGEQLLKEEVPTSSLEEWGIVAIHSASHPFESPMIPVTMMRNALGIDEGGSGVPLDREAYLKGVNYWGDHAVLR